MLALTSTEGVVMNGTSMSKEDSADALVIGPWPSGRSCFPKHHPGYIDWATFQANQARIDSNIHPQAHQGGGAVRKGAALLQGLARCG
jgi:hypothetical protein